MRTIIMPLAVAKCDRYTGDRRSRSCETLTAAALIVMQWYHQHTDSALWGGQKSQHQVKCFDLCWTCPSPETLPESHVELSLLTPWESKQSKLKQSEMDQQMHHKLTIWTMDCVYFGQLLTEGGAPVLVLEGSCWTDIINVILFSPLSICDLIQLYIPELK